jgi:hypothetical protein
MKEGLSSIEPEAGSAHAVQSAATALELNRGRLAALLDEPKNRPRFPLQAGLKALVHRVAGMDDLAALLRLSATKHPFAVLALSAGAGSLAYLVLPRLATGVIVPVLWSEGRLLLHELLVAWLKTGPNGRRSAPL